MWWYFICSGIFYIGILIHWSNRSILGLRGLYWPEFLAVFLASLIWPLFLFNWGFAWFADGFVKWKKQINKEKKR